MAYILSSMRLSAMKRAYNLDTSKIAALEFEAMAAFLKSETLVIKTISDDQANNFGNVRDR